MSTRELITQDIISALKQSNDPRFGLVSREPIDPQKLSRAQFPALFVSGASEERADITNKSSQGVRRQARVEFNITGYVQGANLDQQRNDLIEAVEDRLDQDRTRGGLALDTQVILIETDDAQIAPEAVCLITVAVTYTYIKGNS